MAAGYELPDRLIIHGYLLVGGEKMSKTRGNVLDPFPFIEEYGTDPLRYYLMREVTLRPGRHFSAEGFEARYNKELANELGNLLSRVVSMIGKYRDGAIPQAGPEGEALAAVAAEGEAMVARSAEQYADLDVTAALDTIWEFVRRLNRLVEEEAPWKLAKDEAQAARLDAVLNGLAAGLRLVALAVYPVIPATAVEVLRRIGQAHGDADLLLDKATWAALTPGQGRGRSVAVPAARDRGLRRRRDRQVRPGAGLPPMTLVDSHCHLEMIADTAGAVAEARAAGVEQLVTIGIDLETSRQAAELAATLDGVYATVGLHPHEAHLLDDALLAEFEELAARPRVVAVGEVGLDFYRDLSPRDAQRRAFSAQIELARRTGLPLVVHVREAGDEAMAQLAAEAGDLTVVMHCFSLPEYVDECNERGYYASFAGNVTYKNAGELREAARRVRGDRHHGGDRRAVPHAGAQPWQQQRPGLGGAHRRAGRRGARRAGRRARRAHDGQRAARLRARRGGLMPVGDERRVVSGPRADRAQRGDRRGRRGSRGRRSAPRPHAMRRTARTTWSTRTSCTRSSTRPRSAPTTSSSRSGPPAGCSRVPCSSARGWCTPSRSTAAGCRGSRSSPRPTRASCSTPATRSRPTSARSTRRPPRWSPTWPTTSPSRSS